MSSLNIIYRISDNKTKTNLDGINKQFCLNNFIEVFGIDNLLIIADNCKSQTIDLLKECKLNYRETSLGNSNSFSKILDISTEEYKDEDNIYLCEDDYIHKVNSKDILLEGLEIAEFVSLYDHPDKYGLNSPNPLIKDGGELSKVLLTKSSHWKTTNSTTMTFACKIKTIKEFITRMKFYLDSSIPKDYIMWRDILCDNVRLISSIPGYSTHCHKPWITPFFFRG
jgi:hypothetical protein